MKEPLKKTRGGYLLILAGICFFAAAILGGQKFNYGVGVMFILLGISFIIKNRKQAG